MASTEQGIGRTEYERIQFAQHCLFVRSSTGHVYAQAARRVHTSCRDGITYFYMRNFIFSLQLGHPLAVGEAIRWQFHPLALPYSAISIFLSISTYSHLPVSCTFHRNFQLF